MAQIDTRKDGTAMVPMETTPVSQSSQVLGRIAERHPSGMPTRTAHPSAATARVIVYGNCSDIVCATLRLENTSAPRSPRSTLPMKMRNW